MICSKKVVNKPNIEYGLDADIDLTRFCVLEDMEKKALALPACAARTK